MRHFIFFLMVFSFAFLRAEDVQTRPSATEMKEISERIKSAETDEARRAIFLELRNKYPNMNQREPELTEEERAERHRQFLIKAEEATERRIAHLKAKKSAPNLKKSSSDKSEAEEDLDLQISELMLKKIKADRAASGNQKMLKSASISSESVADAKKLRELMEARETLRMADEIKFAEENLAKMRENPRMKAEALEFFEKSLAAKKKDYAERKSKTSIVSKE